MKVKEAMVEQHQQDFAFGLCSADVVLFEAKRFEDLAVIYIGYEAAVLVDFFGGKFSFSLNFLLAVITFVLSK